MVGKQARFILLYIIHSKIERFECVCLHCTYPAAIFKLEYKNISLNRELICIQLAVGSKEHIRSLYFNNIKYILTPNIFKDKSDN